MHKEVKDKRAFNSFSVLIIILLSIPYFNILLNSHQFEKNENTTVWTTNISEETEKLKEDNYIEDYKFVAYSFVDWDSTKNLYFTNKEDNQKE